MIAIKQSTARNVMVFMVDSTDHITPKTGLTLTVTISKNGAAFGSISPTVTERGNGWYNVALTATDTDTLGELAGYITATGADAFPFKYSVEVNTASDVKTDTAAIKTKTDNLPSGIKKNTALNNFEFLLVSDTDHFTPSTGRTVTAQRSIDGGAFGACTNSVTEVSNGIYKINLSTTDMNGDIITFRFSATGADTRLVTVATNS